MAVTAPSMTPAALACKLPASARKRAQHSRHGRVVWPMPSRVTPVRLPEMLFHKARSAQCEAVALIANGVFEARSVLASLFLSLSQLAANALK